MSTLSVKPNPIYINVPDVHSVDLARPFHWLRMGLHDLRRGWPVSLAYGGLFAALGWVLVNYAMRNSQLAMVMTTGFLLVAPFLAIGFYEVSRRLEHRHGLRGIRRHFSVMLRNSASIGLFAVMLGFILSAWERISALLVGLFLQGDLVADGYFRLGLLFDGGHWGFVLAYGAFGALLAALVFCLSVVSLPMMMDRRVDMVTAIVTSLLVVRGNPLPMLVWAGLIAGLTVIGFFTWFIGLAIVFPVLGHATWHAYRELVQREAGAT